MWQQVYNPFGNMALSALVAAIPVFVLLGSIALFEIKAHYAAILGLIAALVVAILGFGMPAEKALLAAGYGAAAAVRQLGHENVVGRAKRLPRLENRRRAVHGLAPVPQSRSNR